MSTPMQSVIARARGELTHEPTEKRVRAKLRYWSGFADREPSQEDPHAPDNLDVARAVAVHLVKTFGGVPIPR